jgi:hypothetical protein
MDDEIFCFGSNLRGIHGKGSALYARMHYGAKMGVGEGRCGQAYAIPTKTTPWERREIGAIAASVNRFLSYARRHPELRFKVVRIGCMNAGFSDDQMAPLFEGAPENCFFDPLWERFGLKCWENG